MHLIFVGGATHENFLTTKISRSTVCPTYTCIFFTALSLHTFCTCTLYIHLLATCVLLFFFFAVLSLPRDLVVECLDDRDDSIRLRALDLIAGMVSKKNLMEITKKLISHMDDSESASYRDEVLSKIVLICSQNNYQYITNFEW